MQKEELKKHLSDTLDTLWAHYGNGFGGEEEKLIAEIQLAIQRLELTNEDSGDL